MQNWISYEKNYDSDIKMKTLKNKQTKTFVLDIDMGHEYSYETGPYTSTKSTKKKRWCTCLQGILFSIWEHTTEEKTGFTAPNFVKWRKWRSLGILKRATKTVFCRLCVPNFGGLSGSTAGFLMEYCWGHWEESKSTIKQNNQAYLKTTSTGTLERVKRYIILTNNNAD